MYKNNNDLWQFFKDLQNGLQECKKSQESFNKTCAELQTQVKECTESCNRSPFFEEKISRKAMF